MTRNADEFVNHIATALPRNRVGEQMGNDHICILLALFNGAATLAEQLESLASQTHTDWSLIVSDDGSNDNWLDIVSRFSKTHGPGRTWLTRGPGKGSA